MISDPVYVITFYLVGGLLLAAATVVVTAPDMPRASLALAATFALTGALCLLVNAELLFGLLVIGAGAIALVMGFAARSTMAASGPPDLTGRLRLTAAALAAVALAGLTIVLAGASWAASGWPGLGTTTRALAHQLVRRYSAPFGIMALLLLASVVGATLLVRQEGPRPSVPAPGRQRRERGRGAPRGGG